mgnify:CR=1 FL=1|tara:strand:+ start:1669 stop:2505 length:837 start_codon:yes stop_codon:yes gene_type:complete
MYKSLSVVKKLNTPNDSRITKLALEATECAIKHGLATHYKEAMDTPETLIVAIGGDGTMLYAARRAIESGATIVGINTGNLGFLTEFSPDELCSTIKKAITGKDVRVEERTMLSVEFDGSAPQLAFNEITISNNESDKSIQYGLEIEGFTRSELGEHRANCIIIATPTGSTAYSLNAGGAILEPDLDIIQIMPVAAMSMTTRPVVVGGDKEVIVTVRPQFDSKACLKLDGRTSSCFPLNDPTEIRIRRHTRKVKMLHNMNWNFFSTLTEKLHWNRPII